MQVFEITDEKIAAIHPGEVLLLEFLQPMNIGKEQLAQAINVPVQQIQEVVQGERSVNAELALRLSHYFGLSEKFWLNLQIHYDLEIAKDNLTGRLETEVKMLTD
jgi:antitoxin HigA-1